MHGDYAVDSDPVRRPGAGVAYGYSAAVDGARGAVVGSEYLYGLEAPA